MGYLENIKIPEDIKGFSVSQLQELSQEIRKRIVEVTSRTGGHVAASLGATDIAIALHYVLDTPKDKILWDVGHQAYAHKILTGRNDAFETLRQLGGISGFPNHEESEYDTFTVGHSSTAISQALGLACARDIKKEDYKIVAVVGDASLSNGMSLEALNDAGHKSKDITIILNDNKHSISRSVGAISRYLNRVMTNPAYNKAKDEIQAFVKRIPKVGDKALNAAKKLEESIKNMMVPGALFEELEVRYFGPIDGHNMETLVNTLKNVCSFKGPKIIHVITQKGKGYGHAENDPSFFHGLSAFDIETGEPVKEDERAMGNFSDVFGRKLLEMAKGNENIVAVTAAMTDGTGLTNFAKEMPERFFDVGIAEGHAVTFSAAMAKGGCIPFVAIYSTFLQRGYDQLIHDVALQNLPVIFCLDRAGVVGQDGPTHHGIFDMAYLRHIPNFTIMSPRDGFEMEKMMDFAVTLKKPVAIRYPRGEAVGHLPASTFKEIEYGKAEILREGKDLAIFAIGYMVQKAIKIADLLSEKGIEAYIINARFCKPLDSSMIEYMAEKTSKFLTLENGVIEGGFGSAVLEFIERENIKNINVKRIGWPDMFIEHGKTRELFTKYHMTAEQITENVLREMF
ncbi:MAG: 1-deoxy-D-xylulose-5-phosphate synthase [Candidatus Omnitrophica bacterium]|nr:1-deoxy-D-xylulose-5-phosphate synthase [Candidatus Omnitrophota bacterium]